jgi:hypothetical protein
VRILIFTKKSKFRRRLGVRSVGSKGGMLGETRELYIEETVIFVKKVQSQFILQTNHIKFIAVLVGGVMVGMLRLMAEILIFLDHSLNNFQNYNM